MGLSSAGSSREAEYNTPQRYPARKQGIYYWLKTVPRDVNSSALLVKQTKHVLMVMDWVLTASFKHHEEVPCI